MTALGTLASRWGPVLAWMAVIYVFSGQESLPSIPQPQADVAFKKLSHLAEYAILAILVLRAMSGTLDRPQRRGTVVAAFALTALYAVSDEVHQMFVAGRNGSVVDVAVDVVGALVTLCLVDFRARRMEKKSLACRGGRGWG